MSDDSAGAKTPGDGSGDGGATRHPAGVVLPVTYRVARATITLLMVVVVAVVLVWVYAHYFSSTALDGWLPGFRSWQQTAFHVVYNLLDFPWE